MQKLLAVRHPGWLRGTLTAGFWPRVQSVNVDCFPLRSSFAIFGTPTHSRYVVVAKPLKQLLDSGFRTRDPFSLPCRLHVPRFSLRGGTAGSESDEAVAGSQAGKISGSLSLCRSKVRGEEMDVGIATAEAPRQHCFAAATGVLPFNLPLPFDLTTKVHGGDNTPLIIDSLATGSTSISLASPPTCT